MVNWKQDLALSVVLFIMAAAFYITGQSYPATTALFPSRLSPILALLAVLLGVSAYRHREPGQALFNLKAARGPVLLVLLTAAFIVILPFLGFILSCMLLATSIFIGLGYPNKVVAVVVAIVASLAIYAIFHIALEVSLPVGSVWTELMEQYFGGAS